MSQKKKKLVTVEPVSHEDVKGKTKLYLKVMAEGEKGEAREYYITVGQKTFDTVKSFQEDGAETKV